MFDQWMKHFFLNQIYSFVKSIWEDENMMKMDPWRHFNQLLMSSMNSEKIVLLFHSGQ